MFMRISGLRLVDAQDSTLAFIDESTMNSNAAPLLDCGLYRLKATALNSKAFGRWRR